MKVADSDDDQHDDDQEQRDAAHTPPTIEPTGSSGAGGAAHCTNCVTRREPWKLPSAPSSKPDVEPIRSRESPESDCPSGRR